MFVYIYIYRYIFIRLLTELTTTTANTLIPPGSWDAGIENFSIPDPGIGKNPGLETLD